MRILLSNDKLYGGGTETLLQSFTERLLNNGHEITIVATPDDSRDFKTVFPYKVRFIRGRWPKREYKNKIRSFFNLAIRKVYRPFALIKILRKKYDVAIALIEGHNMKEVASYRAKRKYAWIQCDYRNFHHRDWYKRVFPSIEQEQKCMRRYDNIVCVSETAREGVVSTAGDTGNLCIRYNPIDWKRIRELSAENSGFLKDSSKMLIVAVGRLVKDKNYDTILDACSILKDKIPFDLWIVGNGDQQKHLEELIEDKKLTNVRLLGFQANPFAIIRQADLFVSASISETYGLSVQEALIVGVPVVAVKCSGIIESLDPRFGVLIDNSSEELAGTIRRLFENPSELDGYRKTIAQEYSLDSLYEERMDKICRLIEGGE